MFQLRQAASLYLSAVKSRLEPGDRTERFPRVLGLWLSTGLNKNGARLDAVCSNEVSSAVPY